MENVSKTLYIPLYGKAKVSEKGIILKDEKAEEIWAKEGFAIKGKAKSKWLSYFMGMRASVIDEWTKAQLKSCPEATVLHLGCGLDSRVLRVKEKFKKWYDVDFADVIETRKQYYSETESYHMIGGDVSTPDYLEKIDGAQRGIVVMEGLSMYLTQDELKLLLSSLKKRFASYSVIMDSYTVFAAKVSRRNNPINSVGAKVVSGFDDQHALETESLRFVQELSLTPKEKIMELKKSEQWFFKTMFASGVSKKIYRLYTYESQK